MLKRKKLHWEDIGVNASISAFSSQGSANEIHGIITIEPKGDTFDIELGKLHEAQERLLSSDECKDAQIIFKRYLLSDSTNQQHLIPQNTDCAVSCIQQPPLNGSKVALWIYMVSDCVVSCQSGMLSVEHNGYKHLWHTNGVSECGDSAEQTDFLLREHESKLREMGADFAEECVRTWFFVRDVDTQYHGLVKARRAFFNEIGLTPDTHYIASTGIGGNPAATKALIQYEAYTLCGASPEQRRYLYALSHLNRTIEYGVTFERGTLVEYGDRKHAYISGTASIDNKGNVMHIGDIKAQTSRMFENVEALLKEADMTFDNIAQTVVYIRDIADYITVSKLFEQKCPDIPYVITLAPVCRPTWLIEMECIAIADNSNNSFRPF